VALTGTVSGSDAGRLSGATVTFLDGVNVGRTASTNSNGEYRFENVTEGNANLSATASGYAENRGGVFVNGTNTLNFTLQRSGPLTEFGPGKHRVGVDIAPGRYYSDPVEGCYWERQRGLSGTPADVTANELARYDAAQLIVDILPSDAAFEANAQCGRWSNDPKGGQQSSIRPGTYLVNRQVEPGTWHTEARNDCYWERLKAFRGDTGDVIANGFTTGDETIEVDISSSDVGFKTLGPCGVWTRGSSSIAPARRTPTPSTAEILRNRELSRRGTRRP
jgi:hypothetical protein